MAKSKKRKRLKHKSHKERQANIAATDAMMRALIQTLYRALQTYPLGSRRNRVVLEDLRYVASTKLWEQQPLVIPLAIQALVARAKNVER
jgi:hypothetical protein